MGGVMHDLIGRLNAGGQGAGGQALVVRALGARSASPTRPVRS